MTLDPDRFELAKMRYFVETLKARGQHMIMMVSIRVSVHVDRAGKMADMYTTLIVIGRPCRGDWIASG